MVNLWLEWEFYNLVLNNFTFSLQGRRVLSNTRRESHIWEKFLNFMRGIYMIDTVKIFTFIPKNTYLEIKSKSDIKCMYNLAEKKIFYEIVNTSLKGSFDSRLSIRVDEATRYGKFGYVIEVEGSFHKIVRGQNAFDGFYNIQEITLGFKKMVENAYNIKLPKLKHWFLQRLDITKVFDLNCNSNVQTYINNFRLLTYPRRNLKFYENESVYVSGQTTTLKIYNKLKEFLKNDKKKLSNFYDFDLFKFCNKIDGYVRFECEIKKKKLKSLYETNYIRVDKLTYKEFDKIWCDEFMKILKFDSSEIKKITNKNDVLKRLKMFYKSNKANDLYAFYLSIKVDGENFVKNNMSKTTFYRKRKELKDIGIDFSGCFKIFEEDKDIIYFNPFTEKEKEII